jgi:broad specificity phosphatase PhoE
MSLYFIRHGESQANEQNLFAGRLDTPLTELGRRQAEQAGRQVAALKLSFDEIHVSTLTRAQETGRIVTRFLPQEEKPRTVVSELLTERDFGILSEKNKSLIKKHYGAHGFEHMFHSSEGLPPGGEAFMEMYQRTKDYYEKVLLPASQSGKCILVVSHKYIVEMFALIAANVAPEDYFDFKIPNSKPCSWDDLGKRVRQSSARMNNLGEQIEARLPSLLVVGMLIGVFSKLFLKWTLPSIGLGILSTLFLAVNSYIAFLRVEPGVIQNIGDCVGKIWKGAALRIGGGLLLVFGLGGPLGWAAGTFLLLPPAMTAPTLSLMWGGDYFLSVQATLLLSIVSPVALFLISRTGLHVNVMPFMIMFFMAGLVPALAAQIQRRMNPIQTGALATNWGWVGGASLIPLAVLTGYGFTPAGFSIGQLALRTDALFAFVLFAAIYVLGWIAARISTGSTSLKRDVFITHTVPNLFFWASLLPSMERNGAIPLFSALFFFLSILLQEKVHVRRFGREVSQRHSTNKISLVGSRT